MKTPKARKHGQRTRNNPCFKSDVSTSQQNKQNREIALVINLRSRSGLRASERAIRELERHGVQVGRSYLVTSGQALIESIREAINSGYRTIVVGGGDGTISAAVDLLANKPDLTMGLLPFGTGNEVARVLGIPLDLEDACRVVAHGRVNTVDLAETGGNYFVHTAMIGYPAQVNSEVPSWLKQRLGKTAYAYTFLRSIAGARPFRVTMTVGEARWEGETILVIVGNGQFHTPASAFLPRSEYAESSLLVYTPRSTSWTSLVRLAIDLWVTRRRQPSLLLFRRADKVAIVANPPQVVDLDGEIARTTPVTIQIARNALRVLVP